MRGLFVLVFLFFFSSLTNLKSQVGIGTNTPHSSSVLDLTSSNKGFLPSRIALTGRNDVATIASPASGLLIYNTATAGTSPNSVSPGYYYFNGTSWVAIATSTPDATIEFSVKSNPNTAGTTFSPNTPQSKDFIYVSTIDGSQWTWNGTAYILYIGANSPFYLTNTTSDAGNNKTEAVSRPGVIGIGGNATIGTLFSMTQSATYGYGFQLQGTGVSGGSSTGAKWVLGYNATGNKQHWFGDYDAFNATTGVTVVGKPDIIRFIHFTGQPAIIDALPLSTTGSGGANAGSGALNIGQWRVGIGSETGTNASAPFYTGHIHGTLGVDNLPTITNAISVLVKDPSTQQVKQELITDIKNTEFNLISTSTDAGGDKTTGIWRSGGLITGGSSTSTMYGNLTTSGGTNFSGGVPYGTASIGLISNTTAGWTGSGFLFGNSTGGSNAFTATINNDKVYQAWLAPNNTYNLTSMGNATGWMFGSNINAGLSPTYALEARGELASTSNAYLATAGGGKVGVNTTSPISQIANTNTATVGSDGRGTNSLTLTTGVGWAQGYVASFYNSLNDGTTSRNGLAIKVAQATSSTFALDVSQGTAAGTAGTPLLTVLGSGFTGIGTNAPYSQLANTSATIQGSVISSIGGGFNWVSGGTGFAHSVFVSNTIGSGAQVKVSGTSATTYAFEVSQATTQGGITNPLFNVIGNGNTGIKTNTPAYNLDVNGTARIVTLPQITTATDVLVPDPSTGQVSKQSFASVKRPLVKEVTSAYTITAADEGYLIYVNSASAVNVTVPSMVVGFMCEIVQEGAGQVTLVNGTGNTLRSANGLKTRVQYSSISVKFKTTALSTVTGDSTI